MNRTQQSDNRRSSSLAGLTRTAPDGFKELALPAVAAAVQPIARSNQRKAAQTETSASSAREGKAG